MSEYFRENLKFLLWQHQRASRGEPPEYRVILARWLYGDPEGLFGPAHLPASDRIRNTWDADRSVSAGISRDDAALTEQWMACRRRAAEILKGAAPTASDMKAIARANNLEEDILQYTRLLPTGEDFILKQNLAWLIRQEGRGGQKRLAEASQTDPADVSKWVSGARLPSTEPKLNAILQFFKLQAGTNLREQPLFLEERPVSETARRLWLIRRVEHVSSARLADMFPALDELLSEE